MCAAHWQDAPLGTRNLARLIAAYVNDNSGSVRS